ncbi:MAG: flagellar filament capping protein FliD [Marinobacterium sp.]|nr:flagellar filament capping protein FliD [Marinobacterium sp.]
MGNNIISALGAGSGINTKELVDGLISAERAAPDKRLDTRKEEYEAQISAYGTLKSSLEEFKKVLDPLTNPDTFDNRSGTLPTNELLSAVELSPGAQTGTFKIKVDQLAQAQSLATATVADPDAQLLAGGAGEQTLTVNFGKWTYGAAAPGDAVGPPTAFLQNPDTKSLEIKITEGNSSLIDIAKAINEQDSELQAAVIKDGSGGSKLLLTAPSGEQQQLQIQSSHASLSMLDYDVGSANMEVTQAGQDARLEMNGLKLTRSSNTIDDVVQGFKFNLDSASATDTVTFTISEDQGTAEQAVRDFIEAFNTFAETANNLKGVTEDEETGKKTPGALSTDGAAKQIISNLLGSKSESISGLDENFNRLSSIGIMTKKDGGLEIDEDIFKKALEQDYDKVTALFARSETSSSTLVKPTFSNTRIPPDGDYTVEIIKSPEKAYVETGVMNIGGFPLVSDHSAYATTFDFQLNVHGENVYVLVPEGTYNTPEEWAEMLEGELDRQLSSRDAIGVDVTYDAASQKMRFTSEEYGSQGGTGIVFGPSTNAFRGTMNLAGQTSGLGQDMEGTINGEKADVSSSGNILLAPFSSKYSGAMFDISPGSQGTHTIGFSLGFAGNLLSDIENLLSSNGAITQREEALDKNVEKVDEDKKKLDERMEKATLRYQSQFLEMERVLAGLADAQGQLDNLLKTLFPENN